MARDFITCLWEWIDGRGRVCVCLCVCVSQFCECSREIPNHKRAWLPPTLEHCFIWPVSPDGRMRVKTCCCPTTANISQNRQEQNIPEVVRLDGDCDMSSREKTHLNREQRRETLIHHTDALGADRFVPHRLLNTHFLHPRLNASHPEPAL